jgi:hypothetical protein
MGHVMRIKKTIKEKWEQLKKETVATICDSCNIHISKHYPRTLYEEFMGKKKQTNNLLSSELGYEWDQCEDQYL